MSDMAEIERWQKYVEERDAHIKELNEALSLLLQAFDNLLPGAAKIACNISLINNAAMKARPLVDEYKNNGQ